MLKIRCFEILFVLLLPTIACKPKQSDIPDEDTNKSGHHSHSESKTREIKEIQDFDARLQSIFIKNAASKVFLMDQDGLEAVEIFISDLSLTDSKIGKHTILFIPILPEQVEEIDISLRGRISKKNDQYYIDIPINQKLLGIDEEDNLELVGF